MLDGIDRRNAGTIGDQGIGHAPARAHRQIYLTRETYDIRNHKEEDVVVSVVERLSGDWTIVDNSHRYDKEASHRVRFDVPVERKASSELTYTARIRY